jgi:hypothetical protein
MKKEDAYQWIENNFFGDLTECEQIENLKCMIDRIYKEEYIYIYKNSLGRYELAKNMEFIAKHKCCRAFKIKELEIEPKRLISYLNNAENLTETIKEYVDKIKFDFVI